VSIGDQDGDTGVERLEAVALPERELELLEPIGDLVARTDRLPVPRAGHRGDRGAVDRQRLGRRATHDPERLEGIGPAQGERHGLAQFPQVSQRVLACW